MGQTQPSPTRKGDATAIRSESSAATVGRAKGILYDSMESQIRRVFKVAKSKRRRPVSGRTAADSPLTHVPWRRQTRRVVRLTTASEWKLKKTASILRGFSPAPGSPLG